MMVKTANTREPIFPAVVSLCVSVRVHNTDIMPTQQVCAE